MATHTPWDLCTLQVARGEAHTIADRKAGPHPEKGLGEKAGNYLSDAEFKIQKAKVLENYRKKN